MRDQIITSVVLISIPPRQPRSWEGLASLPGNPYLHLRLHEKDSPLCGPLPASTPGLVPSPGLIKGRKNPGLLCHTWAGPRGSRVQRPKARTRMRLT